MINNCKKFKVQIVVPLEADDFIEAAAHQRRLNGYFARIAERYQASSFRIIERRGRGLRQWRRPPASVSSGRLHTYD